MSYCTTLYCIFYGSEEDVDFLNTLSIYNDFPTRCWEKASSTMDGAWEPVMYGERD